MAKIVWSDLAKCHLKDIDAYIAEGSPYYSIVFIDKLIASVEKIGVFPRCGRVVPEFERDDVREIIYCGYRIVYRITEETVTILAVVHGAMDISRKREREAWDLS